MSDLEKLKADYSLKKDKIQERLSQFEKFFNESYSWYYMGNELRLLPVETKDDARLFEELSFCIFTANASAEMGLKSVDAVRNVLMVGTAEDMSKRIEGIHRFSNVRPQYIVHTRSYLKNTLNFELKKKLLSFANNN